METLLLCHSGHADCYIPATITIDSETQKAVFLTLCFSIDCCKDILVVRNRLCFVPNSGMHYRSLPFNVLQISRGTESSSGPYASDWQEDRRGERSIGGQRER